jgi:DNA-binding MarR family transcriptional regulator
LTVKFFDYIVAAMDDLDSTELATPTLMRAARGVYARAIRAELHEVGLDDLPRNGALFLAGIAAGRAPSPGHPGGAADDPGPEPGHPGPEPGRPGPMAGLPASLGVTKQAVSQLTDVLVSRGYVTRGADPGDRRRVVLELTERGQHVVEAVARGVHAVDAQLRERAPAEQIEAMRSTLGALADIKIANVANDVGLPRPSRQFRRFSPIFPVRDVRAALAHYASLGFDTTPYEDGTGYGFARREGAELHLTLHPDHDSGHSHASAYLYVRDADEVYAEWSRPGIGGETRPVGPTPYKVREGSHVDPDGNLIRFGSFVEE